jgi:two-component system, OmpR family, phosphate regulon sensor histidine kinase PhoR
MKELKMINPTFSTQHQPGTRNLIWNAIKYTPEGGVTMISLEHEAGMANVKIQDTGHGIPRDDLPHVFDRFYRVRTDAHAGIEGNGLGLAIVKSIAEEHLGDVTVESEVGKGSCFKFMLPLAQSDMTDQRPTKEL